MSHKGKTRHFSMQNTGEFIVFSIAKRECLDQLLEVFYVLNHRNPGAGVMVSMSPADFVGQLLELFTFLDGNWRSCS